MAHRPSSSDPAWDNPGTRGRWGRAAQRSAGGRSLRDHPACGFGFRSGPLSSTHGRLISTVLRSASGTSGEPEFQIHPMPLDEADETCTLFVFLTRSDAQGHVTIRSSDPHAAPLIDHRYLTGADDMRRFRDAWNLCRGLLATAPFRRAGTRPEAKEVADALQTGLASAHHQTGTCRMGAPDGSSVVDPALRVHGTTASWWRMPASFQTPSCTTPISLRTRLARSQLTSSGPGADPCESTADS